VSDAASAHFARKLAFEADPADVHHDMENGVDEFVLVDVRSADNYARSHAVGAVNIPTPEITEARLAEYEQDTVFIVYCWGPGCNGADKAALKISEMGRPVKMMIGGIEYWEDRERYPVVRG
ncbi:MAG: rhodanese-like domain-containing protein, partial [Chloroflexota bacterium]